MEIEKLIERLKSKDFERDYDCTPFECGVFGLLDDAALTLEQLQVENDRLKKERNEAVIDMTALMAGQCCDLCAVEYCIVRGKTEMCTTFKWRGPKEEFG